MATVTLLTLKQDFWSHQNQRWQGTATGGSTTKITDNAISDLVSDSFPAPVVNRQVRITSGSASGDLRQIVKVDTIRGDMYPNQGGFSNSGPTTGDTYDLWGSGIHGGQSLTNLFNDTARRLRPVDRTQVTIVTNQRIYDVSTLDATREDLIDVWDYLIDPANLVPYTPQRHAWWTAYEYLNSQSGGTGTLMLEIRPALTNASTVQLWVEHYTSLPTFASDTDTIDAKYRDWLVWEAILTYVEREMENVSTDKSVWVGRQKRAWKELRTLRQRWIPRRPIMIRPEVPL